MLKTKDYISNLLDVITPINLEIEKEKFFKFDAYSPIFQYIWKDPEVKLFAPTISKNRLYKAIRSQDNSEIVDKSGKFFETKLDAEVLKLADSLLKKGVTKIETPPIGSVLNEFDRVLKYFDLNYEVKISHSSGFNIRPSFKNKEILISHNIDLSYVPPTGEVKHEMVHIIRSENNFYNNYKFSRKYLPTDEGLACYFQDYYTKEGNNSLFHHSAEYKATEICLNGGFRDAYDFFKSLNYTDDNAWKRAARHKFGFVDTSKPGDIMKPSMYFYTEQKVKDLSQEEKLKLLSGKVSYKDLNNIKEYKGKFTSEKLMEYFFN